MLTYKDREACKVSCLVEGVLWNEGQVNYAQIAKFNVWGMTALHLISFAKIGKDGEGLNAYIERITQLEEALTHYGIAIATLRVNVYDPAYDESVNGDIGRRLHALLRWPQRWLSVVYSHPSQNIPYMLAMNGSTVFYHAGQPVDYPLASMVAVG